MVTGCVVCGDDKCDVTVEEVKKLDLMAGPRKLMVLDNLIARGREKKAGALGRIFSEWWVTGRRHVHPIGPPPPRLWVANFGSTTAEPRPGLIPWLRFGVSRVPASIAEGEPSRRNL
jgi:hypothetical protein